MSNELTLFCYVLGDKPGRYFSVKIASTEFVDSLKDAIKAKKSPDFDAFPADNLDLYKVSIPIEDFDAKLANARSPEQVKGAQELLPTTRLRNLFSSIEEDHIHVILRRPEGECKLSVNPHRCLTIPFVLIISSIRCYTPCSAICIPQLSLASTQRSISRALPKYTALNLTQLLGSR
jgi:hypothetical protein